MSKESSIFRLVLLHPQPHLGACSEGLGDPGQQLSLQSRTGDGPHKRQTGAGTDANVFFVMHGVLGNGQRHILAGGADDFDR